MMPKEARTEKKYADISVLIFGAMSRQSLAMVRGFSQLGCSVTVYCKSKLNTGYLSRFPQRKIMYDPKKSNSKDFMEWGLDIIKKNQFDLVVPTGDATASFLSMHKEEIQKSTKIVVNDWDIFQNAIDKFRTMKICMDYNIPAPKTMMTDDPVTEIQRLGISYPVVVKPKTGVGSIGFNIIRSESALIKYLSSYDGKNGPILVQEYIEQGNAPQYGVDIFRDRDGIIRSALVLKKARWYPLDGGSTVLAVSIHNEQMKKACIDLVNALDWNGFADIDLVWDEKEKIAKIVEINGRIGARVKLDFISGINVAQLIIENELGFPVTSMCEYSDGKQISCFLTDCLWFLKSKNRFSSEPSWFARKGIKDVIFSWDDPIPSIGFLISSIMKYRTATEKRARS